MRSYRLVFLDRYGHVVTTLSVDCMEDREAIAVAEQELAKRDLANCDHVEVWNEEWGTSGLRLCKTLKLPGRITSQLLRVQQEKLSSNTYSRPHTQ
jgi:hypothetical protein